MKPIDEIQSLNMKISHKKRQKFFEKLQIGNLYVVRSRERIFSQKLIDQDEDFLYFQNRNDRKSLIAKSAILELTDIGPLGGE